MFFFPNKCSIHACSLWCICLVLGIKVFILLVLCAAVFFLAQVDVARYQMSVLLLFRLSAFINNNFQGNGHRDEKMHKSSGIILIWHDRFFFYYFFFPGHFVFSASWGCQETFSAVRCFHTEYICVHVHSSKSENSLLPFWREILCLLWRFLKKHYVNAW